MTDDGNGGRDPVAALDRDERVELAVDLLATVDADELRLAEVVDRIETVTTDPALTRTILDAAEKRGVLSRDGDRVRLRTRRGGVRTEPQVVRREGTFACRRCGASLSTGHFVRLEAGELGPFGPECVKAVLAGASGPV
ncbi:MAG: DUF5830 family protein [Haloferacaceae archaeon]